MVKRTSKLSSKFSVHRHEIKTPVRELTCEVIALNTM